MTAPKTTLIAHLSEFETTDKLVKRHDGRSLLLLKDSNQIRALDNRCPHMGFPLSKGTLNDGLLTCHWHHARFDADSGCAFDLWADDIPAYDVIVDENDIRIADTPRRSPSIETYQSRLQQGLEQNIPIIIYKSIAGLLSAGIDPKILISEIAAFGAANHDKWSDGMTLLVLAANLWENLSPDNRYIAIAKAAKRVADNCAGQPPRRSRTPLDSKQTAVDQIHRWMRNWSASRHRDAIERSTLTLIENGALGADLQAPLIDAIYDRVYSDTGHNADFINKALELSEQLGRETLHHLGSLASRLISEAKGEEEKGGWRNPIDLVPILRAAEKRLEDIGLASQDAITQDAADALHQIALGEDPQAIVDCILESVQAFSAISVARELCLLSLGRLARFPESNEVGDWFNPVHSTIHANAVYQMISRSISHATCRGLLHTALAIYQDRYLNLPSPALPNPNSDEIDQIRKSGNWQNHLLKILDGKQSWRVFPNQVVAAFRAGKPVEEILDTIAKAVLREDFDFHKLQVLEIIAKQIPVARESSEIELMLAGVARHTAAHSPTPREQNKLILIAQRLQRGENIQAEQ